MKTRLEFISVTRCDSASLVRPLQIWTGTENAFNHLNHFYPVIVL